VGLLANVRPNVQDLRYTLRNTSFFFQSLASSCLALLEGTIPLWCKTDVSTFFLRRTDVPKVSKVPLLDSPRCLRRFLQGCENTLLCERGPCIFPEGFTACLLISPDLDRFLERRRMQAWPCVINCGCSRCSLPPDHVIVSPDDALPPVPVVSVLFFCSRRLPGQVSHVCGLFGDLDGRCARISARLRTTKA